MQTKDGYGTAVQVNLLRQTVKVKLDSATDDTLRLYKSNELASVPGGRPKDGETPANVFTYVPEPEEEEEKEESKWEEPIFFEESETSEVPVSKLHESGRPKRGRTKAGRNERGPKPETDREEPKPVLKAVRSEKNEDAEEKREKAYRHTKPQYNRKAGEGNRKPSIPEEHKAVVRPVKIETGEKAAEKSPDRPYKNKNRRRFYHSKPHSNDNK